MLKCALLNASLEEGQSGSSCLTWTSTDRSQNCQMIPSRLSCLNWIYCIRSDQWLTVSFLQTNNFTCSFRVLMKEHQKEVELQQGESAKTQSQSKWRPAVTDWQLIDNDIDINIENHAINCDEVTIIGRESDRTTRWTGETVKIWQERQGVMNRDDGTYQLNDVCDTLLLFVATPRGERTSVGERQRNVTKIVNNSCCFYWLYIDEAIERWNAKQSRVIYCNCSLKQLTHKKAVNTVTIICAEAWSL